ncbi:hypothetical protein HZB78_00660 [Candidatus Collierbacteria bacterium]|nr:hypothetical protein [Candidatus Collierbacteria bacterium]
MSTKLFNSKNISILLIIGIAISLSILSIRVWLSEDKFIEVEIMASGDNWWQTQPKVPYWLADAVVPGAIEYSVGGKKLAEVLEVIRYSEDYSKILWAKIRLLVTEDKSNGGWRFQQQPLTIGSIITVKPDHVSLSGNLVSIDGKPETKYKMVNITVKQYGIKSWQAEAVSIGSARKDENGNMAAKIINKKIEQAEASAYTADGKILSRRDPLRVDLTLDLEVQVVEKNGLIYFNRVQPVKIGRKLWIDFDTFEISEASIIKINL